MKQPIIKKKVIICALLAALSLTACVDRKDPINSMRGMKEEREKRLSTAAYEAMSEGRTKDALDLYEQRYEKDSKDQVAAVNYAQLLRKVGNPQKAAEVLEPYARNNKVDGLLLNEYAATQIELGQLEAAEKTLNTVIDNPDLKTFHADAKNLMGVKLASQGRHAEAEATFREAWEGWKGDATSVMNNLGLAQANQGKFEDALTTLRRALAMAPQKTEIARNIEIVTKLRDNAPKAPTRISAPAKPAAKPDAKKAPAKPAAKKTADVKKPVPANAEPTLDDMK